MEWLIYTAGLGPFFTTILLYFLFLILPGYNDLFYVGMVIGIYLLLLVWNIRYLPFYMAACKRVVYGLKSGITFGPQETSNKKWNNPDVWFLLLLVAFGYYCFYVLMFEQLTGHDVLLYAIQGEIFYEDKSIAYAATRFNEARHFNFFALHGFGFPLLSTWERLLDFDAMAGKDLWFKSTTGYYGFLIVLLQFFWLRKVKKQLALIGAVLLLGTFGWIVTFTVYHIDTYRIFACSVLFILTLKAVENLKDQSLIVGLGMFAGFSAFAHSIGVFLAFFAFGALLFFAKGNVIRERLPAVVLAGFVFLVMGGLHYVFDVFFGTGWIFKEIKFY